MSSTLLLAGQKYNPPFILGNRGVRAIMTSLGAASPRKISVIVALTSPSARQNIPGIAVRAGAERIPPPVGAFGGGPARSAAEMVLPARRPDGGPPCIL